MDTQGKNRSIIKVTNNQKNDIEEGEIQQMPLVKDSNMLNTIYLQKNKIDNMKENRLVNLTNYQGYYFYNPHPYVNFSQYSYYNNFRDKHENYFDMQKINHYESISKTNDVTNFYPILGKTIEKSRYNYSSKDKKYLYNEKNQKMNDESINLKEYGTRSGKVVKRSRYSDFNEDDKYLYDKKRQKISDNQNINKDYYKHNNFYNKSNDIQRYKKYNYEYNDHDNKWRKYYDYKNKDKNYYQDRRYSDSGYYNGKDKYVNRHEYRNDYNHNKKKNHNNNDYYSKYYNRSKNNFNNKNIKNDLHKNKRKLQHNDKNKKTNSKKRKRSNDDKSQNKKSTAVKRRKNDKIKKINKGSKNQSLKIKVKPENKKQKFVKFLKRIENILNEEGYNKCKKYMFDNINTISKKYYSTICVKMAQLSKTQSIFNESRLFYRSAILLNSKDTILIEYAKFEKELGNIDLYEKILFNGLIKCNFSKNIIILLIKHFGTENKNTELKSFMNYIINILKKHKQESTIYSIIFEGAVSEFKCGNKDTFILISNYLMKMNFNNADIYMLLSDINKEEKKYDKSYQILINGINNIKSSVKLYRELLNIIKLSLTNDTYKNIKLKNTKINNAPEFLDITLKEIIDGAKEKIDKSIIWKIYVDAAIIAAEFKNIKLFRNIVYEAINLLKDNKTLYLILNKASIIELFYGSIKNSRLFMIESIKICPDTEFSGLVIEMAKLEQYIGNINISKDIFIKLFSEYNNDPNIYIEYIKMKIRENKFDDAINKCNEGMDLHPYNDKLGYLLLRSYYLKNYYHIDSNKQSFIYKDYMLMFRNLLKNSPKNGLLWCELARFLIHIRNYKMAKVYLEMALNFTRQYGDIIIEYIKLYLLLLKPEDMKNKLISLNYDWNINYGDLWYYFVDDCWKANIQIMDDIVMQLEKMDLAKDLLYYIYVENDIYKMDEIRKRNIIFGREYKKY